MLPELRAYPQDLNSTEELLDRHVAEGRGDRAAIFFENQRITYAALVAQVNRLADLQMRDVHGNDLGQVFGQSTHLDLEQYVGQYPAVGLHAFGFAGSLQRHPDGDLLIISDLVEIDMQDLARQGIVLHFLH